MLQKSKLGKSPFFLFSIYGLDKLLLVLSSIARYGQTEDMRYKYASLTNGVQTGSVRIENEGLMDPIPMQEHYSICSPVSKQRAR